MRVHWKPMGAILGAVVVASVSGVADSSGASAATKKVVPPPAGYAQVVSSPFDAPDGIQSTGTAICPAGTVALGGGVGSTSSSLAVNIASSFPLADGSGWQVWMSNVSGSDASFTVQAACAVAPIGYVVVHSAPADNAVGTDSGIAATCPKGQVVYGGGASTSSHDPGLSLSTSTAVVGLRGLREWSTAVINASAIDDTVTGAAVCGKKLKGYSLRGSWSVDNPAGTQATLTEACPTTRVPISVGLFQNPDVTTNDSVSIHSAAYGAHGMTETADNAGSGDSTFLAYDLICAG